MDSDDETSAVTINQHLERYVAKYSVYDDVMLLDAEGKLRTRLKYSDADTPRDDTLTQSLSQSPVFQSTDHCLIKNHPVRTASR